MMLSALYAYYHRLAARKDRMGKALVPPYGFSEEKISFCVVLNQQGECVDIQDVRDQSGKKAAPSLMSVPQPEKRTSGIRANFLWDKTAYVLGVEGNKDKAQAKTTPWVVSAEPYAAFQKHHADLCKNTDDEGLQTLLKFLAQWQPAQFAEKLAPFTDITAFVDSNVVFKLDGAFEFLHERPAARALWGKSNQPEEGGALAECLVTGKTLPIARLHPAIKGVYGGQSSGGSIVSFNTEAYASFGKAQGDNAPISEEAAFAYTTALNFLLRRENGQCVSIGDTSTVFWAIAQDQNEDKADIAMGLFAQIANTPVDAQNEARGKIAPIMEQIAKGRALQEINPELAHGVRFYVLGLAPNASRLSIRYWLETDFGVLADNLRQHFLDLQIEPLPWREPPSMWRLLIQTAVLGKTENISPLLAGEFMRAILTGSPYHRALLTQIVQRFRADGDINGLRVSIVKAVLAREFNKGFIKEKITMALDEQCTNQAYLLGRLMATLENIQRAALGKDINATIVDRYYGAASSVPYTVFPRLLAGCKHHLSKLKKDKPGYAVNLDKALSSIINSLPSEFKRHLSVEEQGRFAIGYYHQREQFFVKKDDTDSTTPQDLLF